MNKGSPLTIQQHNLETYILPNEASDMRIVAGMAGTPEEPT